MKVDEVEERILIRDCRGGCMRNLGCKFEGAPTILLFMVLPNFERKAAIKDSTF